MGKLRRGALWAIFPPAGAVASVRAGRRKDTQRIVDAIEKSGRPTAAAAPNSGVTRTRNGYKRMPNGTVILPRKSLKLYQAWKAAGDIRGLTLAEIVQRVGAPNPGQPGPGRNGLGCTRTWSRPGYTISVWFDTEDLALTIVGGSEQLG